MEGSIWKPTVEIQQGAGCLPYNTDQKLRAKKGVGRGYLEIAGDSFISEFLTPFIPRGYEFIKTFAQLLGVEPRAFLRPRKKANEEFTDELSPTGDPIRKQSIHYTKEG